MSIESDRRAIGSRIEAERRAIGPRMEDNRRAIGAGITAARTSTFKDDLNALETSPRKTVTLSQVEPRGTRPATVGKAVWKEPAAKVATGGIASPLTEPDVAAREYFSQQLLPTTDGLVWVRWKSIKKIVLQDANGAPVVMEFKNGVS